MFTLINDTLYYNNTLVHHEGETFKGAFNAIIFSPTYCYLAKKNIDINVIIDDYIDCTNSHNFEVKIKSITF